MRAMVLHRAHERLAMEERPDPAPGPGQVRVRVEACGVCRTDLHVVDGELPNPKLPIVPGHEIVGRVEAIGEGVSLKTGVRVGVAWLGHSDGTCPYCRSDRENLCDAALFTGYTRDGGYATHTIAEADFVFPLSEDLDPVETAPLLCAGLIGWRSLKLAGDGRTIGVYGFGAAGHIIAQVCRWQGRRVFAFTRPGDLAGQAFARSVGVDWAGGSDDEPPSPSTPRSCSRPPASLSPPRWPRCARRPSRRPTSDAEAKGVKAGDEIVTLNTYNVNREDIFKVRYVFSILRPTNAATGTARSIGSATPSRDYGENPRRQETYGSNFAKWRGRHI